MTVEKVKSAVERHLNSPSESQVLAEYIVSLFSNGEKSIDSELGQFPTPFINEIKEIYLTYNLDVNTPYKAITKSISALGSEIYIPELNRNGRIPDEMFKIGDTIQVKFKCTSDSTLLFQSVNSMDLKISHQLPQFLAGVGTDSKNNVTFNDLKDTQQSEDQVKTSLQKSALITAENLNAFKSQQQRPGNRTGNPVYDDLIKRGITPRPKPAQLLESELPINKLKTQIIDTVSENPITIIVGDTGSGKTTQITKFLLDAGFNANDKVIACTQPRRIAAISVAERVSKELYSKLGTLVGYSVRFDDCYSSSTSIKYMTDGLLLRELLLDPNITKYSVVMLDEAHERSIATDILFGLLKSAVQRRPELRIIVTSATLDARKFAQYFHNAPILKIPGRTFPVTIYYEESPVMDYMEAMFKTVRRIHETQDKGDILVFLTGQAEIDMAVSKINNWYPDLLPLPVYAALPSEIQALIFNPVSEGVRKVILATNIAETSLTVDGVKYVIDSGFSKTQVWDSKAGMSVLKVQPISQAQANQRSGRAGRTAPGSCYRLYTKLSFETEMEPSIPPEILRQNLDNIVLVLKAMKIKNLLTFDFMDKPSNSEILRSMYRLYLLGALDADGNITPMGVEMSKLPLDPVLACVLLNSLQRGPRIANSILTIIAMLNAPNVYLKPQNPVYKRREAERLHHRLADPSGDHLTFLNIYNNWKRNKFSKKWCDQNYIQYKSMMRAKDVRVQLERMVTFSNVDVHGNDDVNNHDNDDSISKNETLKVLCTGFFKNVAKLINGEYFTIENDIKVNIHPGSVLFQKKPKYVLYNSLVLTSREYMSVVSQINPSFLLETVPQFFTNRNDDNDKKRKYALQPLQFKNKRRGDQNKLHTKI